MKPLEGIKVVEMTTYFAAPMSGRMLADWGAEVVKIEGPKGDPYRTAYKGQGTPQFVNADGVNDGCPSYDLENANKSFICLDGRTPEGRDAILKLISTCDVFITNNRPAAMAKMHLTYEDVHALYPNVVYAEIEGYGGKGPLKDKPGFDYTVFLSRSGLLADLSPAGGPLMSSIGGFGDHITALGFVAGICGALVKAKTTGEGDRVAVSLLGTAIYVLSNGILGAEYGRKFPRSHFDCNSPMLQCYKCADGEWIYLAMPEYDKLWPVVCREVFERPDLAVDPRFYCIAETNKHRAEAIAELDKVFMEHDCAYWDEKLSARDLPHEKVAHFKDVLKDEQAWANEYFREYTYPSGDKSVIANTPVKFASCEETPFRHAGLVGANTDEILKNAGFSEDEIAALKESGAAKQH